MLFKTNSAKHSSQNPLRLKQTQNEILSDQTKRSNNVLKLKRKKRVKKGNLINIKLSLIPKKINSLQT